jgi:hypothetical protein
MSSWFPATLDKTPSWHFDAISLVAVLGDSTITEHAQTLTASSLCLIPRLIPAPQALVKTSRPSRLPAVPAIIYGVHSGTRVDELNFYANLIHDVGSLKPLQFKAYRITRNVQKSDSENGKVRDEEGDQEPKYKVVQVQATGSRTVKPTVSIKTFSPLNVITVTSVVLTIGLIAWSCVLHDGVGVISLSTMSLSTLFVGLASRWDPRLTMRPTNAACPPGDIVIRTREGAFVVVECVEEITRELYTGTESADYWIDDRFFKGFVGVGMVLLIMAVVLMGNASWEMQIATGATYLVLNTAYWTASLLPQEWFWDLSHYNVEEVTPPDWISVHDGKGEVTPSFTLTLWYAIQTTKSIDWVLASGAAPRTKMWERWLEAAHKNCDNPDWDAVGEKNRLMGQTHAASTDVKNGFKVAKEATPDVMPASPS